MARNRKTTDKPMRWERGYRCHTLWQGGRCVGRIQLGSPGEWDGKYRCEAGTVVGEAKSIQEAKRWVQSMASLARVQHRLF